MSVNIIQSDIAEVRDQLSLDFSDGAYLNIVSGNLGVARPPYGFDDDTWRAVVKVLALQPKQIRTKLDELLSILLGPRITQCGAFAEKVQAGAMSAVLVNTAQFPQVGTMVIDEGLISQETVKYCYIDRYTNRVYFETPLAFFHEAINAEWETGVIGPAEPLEVLRTVFDPSGFPDPGFAKYTVVVGRGTPYEFVDTMQAVAPAPIRSVILNNGSPMFIPGANTSKGEAVYLAPVGSPQENLYYLTIDSSTPSKSIDLLPLEKGYLQAQVSQTFKVTSGSTTSVTFFDVLTPNAYAGFVVRFFGNVTAALTGVTAHIGISLPSTFFFLNTLPVSPAPGDKFSVSTMFQYIRTIKEDNAVLMRDNLPDLLSFVDGSRLSVLSPTTTISVGQVQVKSGGWDIIESDPDHIEILLPASLLKNDIRSASYVRETGLSGSSTADVGRLLGDADISVTSTASFPLVGVLTHAGLTQYAYFSPHAWLTSDALTGATQITVTDTSLFFAGGGLNLNIGGTVVGPYTVIDRVTLGVPALAADIERNALVRDENIFRLNKVLSNNVSIGDTIDWYAFYDSGDIWGFIDDLWPGPYVWDKFKDIFKKPIFSAPTYPSTVVAGPTVLDVDRVAGNTVFELADASNFPTALPYDVVFGENSGNVETLSVQEISFKQRTHTTVAGTAVSPGDTSIEVAALAGPFGPGNTFPNAGPYRAVLWSGATSMEVVEVVGTATSPDRLLLSFPAVGSHGIGTRVVLLSDLVRVSPAAADDHLGNSKSTDRFKIYAPLTQTADTVRPVYTSLNVGSTADFSFDGGKAYFNFGSETQIAHSTLTTSVSVGATVLPLVDTSKMPSGGPYIVKLDYGNGPLYEERVQVTFNNTGTNQLFLSYPVLWNHAAGVKVVYECGPEENFSYTSTSAGTNLNFDPRLQVQYTHQLNERVAPTVGTGYPRNNGFDFPFRLPVTAEDRIRFVMELVRAAGVKLTFINKR